MNKFTKEFDFINEFSFGILISKSLCATHLPFVLVEDKGKNGALYSHFNKANQHSKQIDQEEVMVIFNGPHGYISPTWYETSPAVPTWNYTTVHAYGKISLLDQQGTIDSVNKMLNKYEPELLQDKSAVTDEYRNKLLSAIVGIEINISHLEGKLKLGQEKPSKIQARTYQALAKSNKLGNQALAKYMQKITLGMG